MEATMELKKILEGTVSPDQNVLQQSMQLLEQAAAASFPKFVLTLSELLNTLDLSPIIRQAAGIQLKNCLVAKDVSVRQKYHNRWYGLDAELRNAVKTKVLQCLGTETHKPSSAASCIAGIAGAELAQDQWPELMNVLCGNAENPESSEALKEATLEAIGYICQDIDTQYLANYAPLILKAIVTRMDKSEQNMNIRIAATNAFLNSLEFIRGNFEKEADRNYIMTVLCQSTLCPEKRVTVAALQSLVKIVSLYYDYIEGYMGPALFAITVNAIKNDEDDIKLQGIEFWSSICDEEIDLAIEAADAEESGISPETYSRFYARGALKEIVPLLLEALTKQDEHDDEEDWTPHKAAGVCMMLLASCCSNEIIPHVIPFIQSNINSEHWNFRDAAVLSFGSIVEGPTADALTPIVLQGIPFLIQLLSDKNMIIRDTVAWTLSRICDQVPEAALSPDHLEGLLNALTSNLDSEPRVATNVCWAISSLAAAAYENALNDNDEEDPQTFILSSKFQLLIEKIIQTGDRPDAHLNNLRSSAYEAVMELVKNSPKDTYETVTVVVLNILSKMDAISKMEKSGSQVGDFTQHNDFKSLLCASLEACIRKLKSDDTLQIAGTCMEALLNMVNMSKVGGVQEDAFMAVGTLVESIGAHFKTFMNAFKPFLLLGLKSKAEHSVCISAIGVVGDLCRGLGADVEEHCDEIMQCCVEILSDNNVHRSVKPHIFSVFGDVALAIGCKFTKYAEVVLTCLHLASTAHIEKTDYDMIDYLNELRDACLEAYTGIVQGLKGEGDKIISEEMKYVQPHVEHMLKFVQQIAEDPDKTDSLIGASCGLLGDVCTVFGTNILPLVETKEIQELLQSGRRSKTNKTKSLAVWATKTIRNCKK